MQLSIIIINYNVKYFLEQCLYSVRRAAKDIAHEIFVVDNNSVDGSVEMLKEKFPEVILLANRENIGFSKANNQAIKQSKGTYVLLLNPDTVIQENTFENIIAFMDTHPDAGGLGVKMIDGKGNFLPESKRGLPTPMVAFYKIFGLARLFPRSKVFGRYHLGFLDKEKIHKVDVLSGAFMLLRKEALDKVGLLDETFFMYGEDIDLSYRIQLAGYKNYYYPETSIIHYKGESTKKSSVNYVFVFYNAMIIFAKKHFSKNNAAVFSFLINIAIYIRAGAAIGVRIIQRLALPFADAVLIYGGMYLLKTYWENYHKYVRGPYGSEFMEVMVPCYIAFWLTGIFLSGGYDRPIRLSKIARGLFLGTLGIVILYAFLNESWRFSRALIVLGAFWSVIVTVGLRLILNLLKFTRFRIDGVTDEKRIVIVAEQNEGKRIIGLLKQTNLNLSFIGFVHPVRESKYSQDDYLGNITQLNEMVEVYQVNEVIFSTKNMSLQEIIDSMSRVNMSDVDFKIAPEESLFIIGSNSVDNPGDLYTIDINFAITRPATRRYKRIVDVLVSFLLLATLPVTIFFVRNTFTFLGNIIEVMIGKRSWVGYANNPHNGKNLPKLKKGVLTPVDIFNSKAVDEHTAKRLNTLYAKHYHIENDLLILWKGWRRLGG